MSVADFLQMNVGNLIAVVWFLLCFRGYFIYTGRRSKDTPTLAFAMHRYRRQWISKALRRENRIADTNIIANLERNVSFFASTTLFILAGLMTVLGSSSEAVITMLSEVPFSDHNTRGQWELKVVLLLCLFVYAFFKFTWGLRQFGQVSVMLGGVPERHENPSEAVIERHVQSISLMASKAAGNFNNGLRTYYFSMAVLGWFVNFWVFMLLSVFVMAVLYRREFRSDTLAVMMSNLPE
ncbi:MAG: DUF599 family protein [Pseudomonadota bacterium]